MGVMPVHLGRERVSSFEERVLAILVRDLPLILHLDVTCSRIEN